MNGLIIVLITLTVHSAIACLISLIFSDNDDVFEIFGLGIVGLSILLIGWIIESILGFFKYHFNKRSIFVEETTGNKYICKTKDTPDIQYWTTGYKLVRRYATKSEWKNIPYFSNEFIKKSKINCDHCKHDKECVCEFPYNKIKCKHDKYGMVLEFEKFEGR